MTQPKIEGVGHGVPRMLFASDGSNWYAILVDSDGHVKIDVVAYPGSNVLGNFPFGYNDRYLEQVVNLSASAGTNTLNGTAVPTGELWVVTAITVRDVNKAGTPCEMGIFDGSTFHRLRDDPLAAADTALEWYGHFYLEAGDNIRAIIYSCNAGDDLYLEINGYKMKLS